MSLRYQCLFWGWLYPAKIVSPYRIHLKIAVKLGKTQDYFQCQPIKFLILRLKAVADSTILQEQQTQLLRRYSNKGRRCQVISPVPEQRLSSEWWAQLKWCEKVGRKGSGLFFALLNIADLLFNVKRKKGRAQWQIGLSGQKYELAWKLPYLGKRPQVTEANFLRPRSEKERGQMVLALTKCSDALSQGNHNNEYRALLANERVEIAQLFWKIKGRGTI